MTEATGKLTAEQGEEGKGEGGEKERGGGGGGWVQGVQGDDVSGRVTVGVVSVPAVSLFIFSHHPPEAQGRISSEVALKKNPEKPKSPAASSKYTVRTKGLGRRVFFFFHCMFSAFERRVV